MTITTRDLERDLLREFGRRLARFGFSPRPQGQTFLQPFAHGQLAVHLSFIRHGRDVDVTADVAVRFDAVEELVNRSDMLLTKRERAETFTFGVELGNLQSGVPFRTSMTSPDDIEAAAERILEKVEAIGWPYLEKYSVIERAFELLARDDEEAQLSCPFAAQRAKCACAMLEVMGRHSEIEQFGYRKLALLESNGDLHALSFSRFLADLTSEQQAVSRPAQSTFAERMQSQAPTDK